MILEQIYLIPKSSEDVIPKNQGPYRRRCWGVTSAHRTFYAK